MDSRDVGLIAVVIVGGLAVGWAAGGDRAVTTPAGVGPASAEGAPSTQVQSPGLPGSVPETAVIPPPPSRTTEGEQLDSAIQARAQSAFQQSAAEAAAGAAPANLPVMPVPAPTQPTSNWGGQSAASGSGWGGQGQSSGGGWGVQAGVAPASPTPPPTVAQPASPAASDQ